MKAKSIFIWSSVLILAAETAIYFTLWKPVVWFMILFGPLILLGLYDMTQKRHAIKRNFPVVGNFRYLLETFRPEIMQYFVETDTEGRPINRIMRSMVYERAKKVNDTTPFGTEMDVYAEGYEWMPHSIYAKNFGTIDSNPRVQIGGADCKQPYNASILNISAMSFGALSKNAVMAMNKGAKLGGFAQNTGEGGLSPYHLKYGGDIFWQIGTGYFGCRTKDGKFSPELFREKANLEQVKMIEIKISQGAKPGHGGVLPASKNTKEIAGIRLVEPHTDVLSPPMHSAFSNAKELTLFIKQLRDLSGGKPVGFKLCVGQKKEFTDICEAMLETGIKPDFITVDGGEGGTGAAPVEFSNSLGMPLREGLSFVYDTLIHYDLKKDIKLIASGKVISGFDMVRTMALGADLCNSARAMMMATGCIQALECNKNTCPTGVATQNKTLMKGLVVEDKSVKVANFHEVTIRSFIELLGAAGISDHSELNRTHIYRRVNGEKVMRYDEIYPYQQAE
ncbi:MAG: FMN-binding glutamate synthase family protein [Bacteroidales bacterium]|nr:FMN-binding glutamate synthase family protein [Bacteroidales bacterium]